jgi:hypothetical protein
LKQLGSRLARSLLKERAMLPDDSLFPDLLVVCAGCDAELPVPDGTNAADVAWLHERRCDAGLLAVPSTHCTTCGTPVEVPVGLSAIEAIWMHQHDCPAYSAAS